MKKMLSAFCILFITVALLAGCSSSKTTEEDKSDFHTVSTVKGDIEISKNVERVIVNWYVGDVITLDLNLVGYNGWAQETMPFYSELNAATKIENWTPEEIMALEPDLIISYDEGDFDKLNKIAPVLVIPESLTPIERIRFIGEATGRTTEAEEAVRQFEEMLATAKQTLKNDAFEGKTFSILEDWGPSGEWSGVGYETSSRGGTLLYSYIGLNYPDKLKELIETSGKGRGNLSYEVAHEYFGDYILWFQLYDGTESEYAKTDIWKSIPAVAEGRVVEIPAKYAGLFYYDDVKSLTQQLDHIVNAINSVVK